MTQSFPEGMENSSVNTALAYMVSLATLNLHNDPTLLCLNYCYSTF